MQQHCSSNPFRVRNVILLLLLTGAAALLVSPALAGTGVTISADGDQAYYLGENVVLRGQNTDSDSTYLFLTGPNLPATGVALTSPTTAVVSGNPDTFTAVKTKPDKTWEYTYYTTNLPLDAGTYTVYAVSQPNATDPPATDTANVGIILKKPFITANISSLEVEKGQPFTVTGTAEGIPTEVRIWIIGNDYSYTTTTPVGSDATFTLNGNATFSGKLSPGQNYLIVQHPMQNNEFAIDVSGEYVRNMKLNNGTNLFKLTGSGHLKGSDAAGALLAAFNDNTAAGDYTADTYTVIPFEVTAAGSSMLSAPAGTGVTISADGDLSYYLGENVVFRGQNNDSDSTYLFLTGPNLPATGVALTSPKNAVVSGNPDTFTAVKTNPDHSWEYSFYTANLPLDAGAYTVYAESQPNATDPPATDTANVGIILKKPFITANISSLEVEKGQPFTVTGTAEGNPAEVRIWIIGDDYAYTTTTPANSDASFTFNVDAAMSGKLPTGQYYLIVQHPMQNNQLDIDVSGEYVRNMKLNNGTNLFKLTGSGHLKGSDAAGALLAAFDDTKEYDDTYTIVPFQVTDTGIGTFFFNLGLLKI